ncbi:MAG: NAD+ synthase [Candidatus Altiarchaeota archaeon]|nr:NAD+ synthase [Candidatus Altiarchaeota archaeon]
MKPLTEGQLVYCRETIEAAVRSFVEKTSTKGVVVALSGGIDSAVVLKLASSVVDVRALVMPEMGVSDPIDIKDAEELAESLQVRYSLMEINDVVDSVKKVFPWVEFSEKNKKLSLANVKPRVRMLLSYLAANLDGRVVLGTSNRTELLLGYMTKFGDSGCDLEPIGALYKTQVRQLALHLGIPKGIIVKRPSAGLWVGQTDEEELGASYEVLDGILDLIVDRNYSVERAAEELEVDINLVERISSQVKGSEHKRIMPAIVELGL